MPVRALTLDWLQLASLVGALQGLLLTWVLASQRKNRTANRLLAALIATFTIYLASTVYYGAGIVRIAPHFFGVAYLTPWFFGPLLYLYALAASDRSWRFERESLIHLAPVALVVAASIPIFLMSGDAKLAMLDRMIAGDEPLFLRIIGPTKYLSGIGYTVATIVYLRRHEHRTELSYSNISRVDLHWLLGLTLAAGGIWLLATSLTVSPIAVLVRDEHISLAMAVLVYAIGYVGLRQPEVFRYETAEYAVPPELLRSAPPSGVATAVAVAGVTPDDATAVQRYARSGLGSDEATRLKAALLSMMDDERPWRESDLTLADLAVRLECTPHKLSEVLNAEIGQTFYDFVNGYRVRDVQRRIEAGEARSRKLLALALDAGFASKSTFNQVFKKHTKQTPSEFERLVLPAKGK